MRIAIIGRSEILYDTALHLQSLGHEIAVVVTAKEAPEYTRTADDFRALAESVGAAFLHAPSMKERWETLSGLAHLPPIDIAVSYNYTGVIPQHVIDGFRLGILNAHGGDLPRYRGNACQAWAIARGEEKIGLCVHRMIGGELDSGPITAREYMKLGLDTTITQVYHWMHARIPVLFEQSVNALADNPEFFLALQSTNPRDALRCYPRRPEDGAVDWSRPAIDILRLINASCAPYAGAYAEFEGEKCILWKAELIEDSEQFVAIAGQVLRVGAGHVDVATGNGKLRISDVTYKTVRSTPDSFIQSIRRRFGNGK